MKKINFPQMVLAASLCVASMCSNAVAAGNFQSFAATSGAYSANLGTLPSGVTLFTVTQVPGSFVDTLNFSLGSSASISAAASSLSLALNSTSMLYSVGGLALNLYDANNQLINSGILNSGVLNIQQTLNAVSASLKISGNATGIAGGIVSGAINVAPVPEPGEWLLMLCGLGVVGFVAVRRGRCIDPLGVA